MPEPSQLVKLEHLHTVGAGVKIRVLGCVYEYDAKSAHLTLRDRYPATAKDAPTAIVDVDSVLNSLNHDLLETGSWLNIMGYVRAKPTSVRLSRKARVTYVEATMVWSAGAIKLEKYHAAVDDLQECVKKAPN